MTKPCRIPSNIDTSAAAIRLRTPPPIPAVVRFAVAVDRVDAAAMLGIHPDTFDDLRRRGEIRPFKIGQKSVRYLVSELQRYGETQMLKQQEATEPMDSNEPERSGLDAELD